MRIADKIKEQTNVPFDSKAIEEILYEFFTEDPGRSLNIVFTDTRKPILGGRLCNLPANWLSDTIFYLNREGFHTDIINDATDVYPNALYVYLFK